MKITFTSFQLCLVALSFVQISPETSHIRLSKTTYKNNNKKFVFAVAQNAEPTSPLKNAINNELPTFYNKVQTSSSDWDHAEHNSNTDIISFSAEPINLQDGQWTWAGGSNTKMGTAVYGVKGIAASGNSPGARTKALSWTDKDGNFWLMGGATPSGLMNDLWRYNLATNMWTWMSGSSQSNQSAIHGTKGIASSDNIPGAREGAVAWSDNLGNLWLMGGSSHDPAATKWQDDFWKYNITSGLWTWMGGSTTEVTASTSVYGIKGVAATNNYPGIRYNALSWTDKDGNLWLMGGASNAGESLMNDLWKYNPGSAQWTWVGGSNIGQPYSVYGNLGEASSTNMPGYRTRSQTWTDRQGNLWLMGGFAAGSTRAGIMNDLWRYNTSENVWTWMGGSQDPNQDGFYGVKGIDATTNYPGARESGLTWADKKGNLWLIGGQQTFDSSNPKFMNDLWKYNTSSGKWTWVSGSNAINQTGTYGIKNTPSVDNMPGARIGMAGWIDNNDNLWLMGGMAYTPGTTSSSWYQDMWAYKQQPVFTPTTQASTISFNPTSQTSATINWTKGNGIKRVVFVSLATSNNPIVQNDVNYTANAKFGAGNTAGLDWYCIYNGGESSCEITNLIAGKDYKIAIAEYNTEGERYQYNTTFNEDNTKNIEIAGLPPQISLPASAYTFSVGQAVTPINPVNKGGIIPATVYSLISTVAGGKVAGATNGNLTNATFDNPLGIVKDRNGNLFVADNKNNLIRKITPDGTVSTFAGSGTIGSKNGTGTEASFNGPSYMAFDKVGNLFVSDAANSLIRKITPEGVVTSFAGGKGTIIVGGGGLDLPGGLAFDNAGNLFVADYSQYKIKKISPTGIVTTFAGSGTTGKADGPGTAASFNSPSALAIDRAGNLFVADRGNYVIRKITPDGTVSTFAGTGKREITDGMLTTAGFTDPAGLTFDDAGNLYITDNYSMVRMITPDGKVTTLVGGFFPATKDGVGKLAGLDNPFGLVSDGVGNLFITNRNSSNSIRKVSLTGFTISPDLQEGLTFESTTGTISGTPTDTMPVTEYTITGYNAYGASSSKLTIKTKQIQTITFNAIPDFTYGDPDISLVATSTNSTVPINYSVDDETIAVIQNGKLRPIKAGLVNITASQPADDTHFAALSIKRSVNIKKRSLTVIAENKARAAGKANPVFTVTYNGFVNGDDETKLASRPTVSTAASSNSAAGIYDIVPSGGSADNYAFVYQNGKLTILPAATNFELAATNITCKGQNNGTVNLKAMQAANYTAVLTGNNTNKSQAFNTTLNFDNLSPGNYNICITDAALPAFQQCFEVAISEPKDLTVYATVNKTSQSVDLSLSGSADYKIEINGKVYQTQKNSISLPLNAGSNTVKVSTDKACQGSIEQLINLADNKFPYPNPFQDVIYVNLGEDMVQRCQVEIYDVSTGAKKYVQQFSSQSGVIRLDVSNLMMGVYSLHLVCDGKETVYKITKK